MVTGDIRKAFLQIRIRESERDALRFHWQREENAEIDTLRLTRALFGLVSSPFLLGGVLEYQLDAWEKKYPKWVKKLCRSLYVDDLLMGGQTILEAKTRKEKAIEILSDATFQLHKWHSNATELEEDVETDDDPSFAKQQLGVRPNETKMLGMKWNKREDTLTIQLPDDDHPVTRRGVLSKLAKIYYPLGLVSPLTLEGKLMYREACDAKTPWDVKLDDKLSQRWKKWNKPFPRRSQYRDP